MQHPQSNQQNGVPYRNLARPKNRHLQRYLEECFAAIDQNKLKEQIIARLEAEAVDKIVNKLITEYSNDIKSIMANQDLREDLRVALKSKIKAVRDLLAKEEAQ